MKSLLFVLADEKWGVFICVFPNCICFLMCNDVFEKLATSTDELRSTDDLDLICKLFPSGEAGFCRNHKQECGMAGRTPRLQEEADFWMSSWNPLPCNRLFSNVRSSHVAAGPCDKPAATTQLSQSR